MKSIVFTAIGPDRPGLVEELSAVVARHGGNWLESRMAHLCGEFAGIVRIEAAADSIGPLREALDGIDGLNIVVAEAADSCPVPAETVSLELTGADRTGIVSEISRALASRGVNVENLETERVSAPMSGEALFIARAELGLPGGLSVAELKVELEGIAADLMVDLNLG